VLLFEGRPSCSFLGQNRIQRSLASSNVVEGDNASRGCFHQLGSDLVGPWLSRGHRMCNLSLPRGT